MIFQLLQVRHLEKKPVIAVGKMWRELSVWFDEHMVEDGFINSSEMDLIHFVDRFSEATILLKGLL